LTELHFNITMAVCKFFLSYLPQMISEFAEGTQPFSADTAVNSSQYSYCLFKIFLRLSYLELITSSG
jgi:hypothetical protein